MSFRFQPGAKPNAIARHAKMTVNPVLDPNHRASFQAVVDSRNEKIPGLWRRGERFYVQLRVDLGNGRTAPRRIPLAARTVARAAAELRKKQVERDKNELLLPGHRPKFEDFASEYLKSPMFLQKKERTQQSEEQAVKRWSAHLGGVRLDKITMPMIHSYREKRLSEKSRKVPHATISARTVNMDVMALRQVLTLAKQRGHIANLVQFFHPHRGGELEALRQRPPQRRPLLSKEQFGALLKASVPRITKNAGLLRYYLRFLALTGAREEEALRVRCDDVNFERGSVTIGADGNAKNSRSRTVDFSPELEKMLRELTRKIPPDASWLFPSPQRGNKDVHALTLRESFKTVRNKARLGWVGFHDLRHFFASQCVMAGIDFMTIASWLGHSDGGILVGKVYGHLADSHKKEAARKLRFFASA